ncbi:MAG: hypothetical protein JHC26_07425 [Thermofilum sp.]|uniref:hypothetical protein n=1 Tax=Thermofilum sp. TaxID=1961369 RepID=UPI0025869D39|nr:hypothetical protein [Thermofilum sp.]MCI4408907.1 hypothetical protein [Thermofilum sp.]
MAYRAFEEKPASRNDIVVFSSKRQRREEWAQKILESKSLTNLTAGLIIMLDMYQMLSAFPEFALLISRLKEIAFLSPEEIMKKYPQLYSTFLWLPSFVILIHVVYQIIIINTKRLPIQVMPGIHHTIDTIIVIISAIMLTIGFMVTKSPVTLILLMLYSMMLMSLMNTSAKRIAERAVERLKKEGATK